MPWHHALPVNVTMIDGYVYHAAFQIATWYTFGC
jgi:hypothetical protein